MPQDGQNPVPRANVERQNPVSRGMLVSQFPWVCPPLCAWGINLTGALVKCVQLGLGQDSFDLLENMRSLIFSQETI